MPMHRRPDQPLFADNDAATRAHNRRRTRQLHPHHRTMLGRGYRNAVGQATVRFGAVEGLKMTLAGIMLL